MAMPPPEYWFLGLDPEPFFRLRQIDMGSMFSKDSAVCCNAVGQCTLARALPMEGTSSYSKLQRHIAKYQETGYVFAKRFADSCEPSVCDICSVLHMLQRVSQCWSGVESSTRNAHLSRYQGLIWQRLFWKVKPQSKGETRIVSMHIANLCYPLNRGLAEMQGCERLAVSSATFLQPPNVAILPPWVIDLSDPELTWPTAALGRVASYLGLVW